MSPDLSRRRVLAGGLAITGAAALGVGGWITITDESRDDPSRPVTEAEATRFVAERALAHDPSLRADARRLAERLERAEAGGGGDRRADVLDRAVVEDFRRGRTVPVEGWLLARSEAAVAVHRAGLVGG